MSATPDTGRYVSAAARPVFAPWRPAGSFSSRRLCPDTSEPQPIVSCPGELERHGPSDRRSVTCGHRRRSTTARHHLVPRRVSDLEPAAAEPRVIYLRAARRRSPQTPRLQGFSAARPKARTRAARPHGLRRAAPRPRKFLALNENRSSGSACGRETLLERGNGGSTVAGRRETTHAVNSVSKGTGVTQGPSHGNRAANSGREPRSPHAVP